MSLEAARSALLVIDVQTSLIPFIYESERTIERALFLTRIAKLLDVPVFATEQNPSRMGEIDGRLRAELEASHIFPKMEFGAHRSSSCADAVRASGRDQLVFVGLETHICVAQSARGFLGLGYESWVCPDGVSARSVDRHKLGMEQIRDAAIMPAHTEAVAYEWLQSADHPRFRAALAIVKEYANP